MEKRCLKIRSSGRCPPTTRPAPLIDGRQRTILKRKAMKKYLLSILLIIVTNGCTDSIGIFDLSSLTDIYYPLKVGNIWYYDVQGSDDNPWIKTIVQKELELNGITYFEVTKNYGYKSTNPYLYTDTLRSDGQGRIINYKNNNEYILYDFTLEDGKTYEYKEYIVLVKKLGTIDTAVGQLNNCIEMFFDIPQYRDDEFWLTFAPNVGLIKSVAGEGPTLLLHSYEF